jgi:hypothetical protein
MTTIQIAIVCATVGWIALMAAVIAQGRGKQ